MTTAQQISELVQRYYELSISQENLSELMEIRKGIAALSFKLGEQTAHYKREFDKSYGSRKVQFFKLKAGFMDDGSTGALSETKAEEQISELRETEKLNEGLYSGCKIILTQANEVLDSLKQDISQLRQELRGDN